MKISFILIGLLTSGCLPIVRQTPEVVGSDLLATPWADRSIFQAGLVESTQPILNKLDGASVYHLEVNIAEDYFHLAGKEKVLYTNTELVELNEINFRLFSNLLGGEMKIQHLLVDDQPAQLTYGLQDSLLIVGLQKPLQPGESTVIQTEFTVRVPETVEMNYGVQAYYDGVLALAHIYPMIPVYDDEGWNAEIPPQSGDLTYTDMAFFLVRVDAPSELVLAAAGRMVESAISADRQTVTYAAGPVRDFFLAASPDYQVVTNRFHDTTLRFYERRQAQSGGEYGLEISERALRHFGDRYTPYPYTELDLTATPTQALGIEYPGIIAINESIVDGESTLFESVLAHEIGHQWFYNLVGNDQLDDPWMDESLAQFLTWQYFTDEYGVGGMQIYQQELDNRWNSISRTKIPIGLPVSGYSAEEYSAIVYGRGGLFFAALRDHIGEKAFDKFMQAYTEQYSWSIAAPSDLQETAQDSCHCDLQALFNEWIY